MTILTPKKEENDKQIKKESPFQESKLGKCTCVGAHVHIYVRVHTHTAITPALLYPFAVDPTLEWLFQVGGLAFGDTCSRKGC